MIEIENIERVRILYLNSPPSNVLNLKLLGALRQEVERAGADAGVRCLVIASKIPKYFSSGLDLGELTSLPPERQAEPFNALLALYRTLYALPKPTLACIGGNAILGGWIIALAADFRILSEDGRIALSEIRFGLSPTSLLIQRMKSISSSPTLVKEMVLRGKTLRAPEALAGGFVDELADPLAVLEHAKSFARGLGKMSPLGYASVKRSLQESGSLDGTKLWEKSMDEFHELFGDPQTKEGIMAMRDKRRPNWE